MNFKKFYVVCTILMVENKLNAEEVDNRISGGFEPFWSERFAVRIISAVNDRTPQGYLSTGAAVTQQHVVTVAQAIAGFAVWRIGYGDTVVDQHYEVICRHAVLHPEFNSTLLHNNVGVIRVPYLLANWIYSPIEFASTVLPNFVAGYGFLANDQLANELQIASIGPLPLFTCTEIFGDEFVRDDNLCFINSNITTRIRNGDQGGPAFRNPSNPFTYAIISFWGLTPGSPIVLLDLSKHQSFLEEQFAT